MKKYIAECLGTFTLSFVVIMAISTGSNIPIAVPIIASLTLGFFVYTIGGISGSHINPAVTLGILSLKKISTQDATAYIISQLIGGIMAFLIGTMVFDVNFAVSFGMASSYIPFLAETIGAFFFTFGIASIVCEKAPHIFSGLIIGGSLLLGLLVASLAGSLAILNPAVALALMLTSQSSSLAFSWIYIIAPIIGSYLGMMVYHKLQNN